MNYLIHNESMKFLAPPFCGYRLRLPSAPYYYHYCYYYYFLGDNIALMAVTCFFFSTWYPSPLAYFLCKTDRPLSYKFLFLIASGRTITCIHILLY